MERSRNDKPTTGDGLDAPVADQPLPAASRDWALFLDIDGTLLEIAPTPEQVQVSARLREVLAGVQPLLEGALALVSGRTVAAVDRLFGIPSLAVAGLHGLEWRYGSADIHRIEGLPPVEALHRPLAKLVDEWPGALLEDKGGTLAVHYRSSPEAAEAIGAAIADLIRDHSDLVALQGKMVVEVKPRRGGKGDAIARFMESAPFRGRIPVFLGDDVTDEHGFATVNRLGGHSIRVGPKGPTRARYRLPDVAAVNDWLENMLRTLASTEGDGKCPRSISP